MSVPLMRGLIGNLSRICIKHPILQPPRSSRIAEIRFPFISRGLTENKSLCSPQRLQQEIVEDSTQIDNKFTKDIVSKVNQQIAEHREGRLFAVVHICGKQFKITTGDIVIVEGFWSPDIGDEISLDKVLCVGGADFSLIGRPLVQTGLVTIKATVIEKSLSHTKTHFRKKKRKQYMRINFYRVHHTMLRINSIEITGSVNNPKDVEGLHGRIF